MDYRSPTSPKRSYLFIAVLCLLFQLRIISQDTALVKTLEWRSDSILSKDLNASLRMARKAHGIMKEYPNTNWYYKTSLMLAKVYYQKDWPDSMISLLEPIHAKLPADVKKRFRATINYRLCNAYTMKLNLGSALERAIEGLKDFEALNDSMNVCNSYAAIANIYQQQGNFKQTEKNLRQAEAIALRLRNKITAGTVYNSIGILYAENMMLDSAEKYFLLSTDIREKMQDYTSVVWNYNNLGGLYILMKQNKKGISYLEKAYVKFGEFENYTGQSSVANNIGELCLEEKDYPKAYKYLTLSRELIQMENDPDNLENVYLNFYVYYKKTNDFKTATKYSDSLIALKDSLYGKRLDQSMAEMQTKYETEKKEKENSELKRKTEVQQLEIENAHQRRRIQVIFILSLAVIVVGIIIFFFNRRKMQQKARHAAELSELEKERFKGVIEAEEKERSRIAQELHDGLGQMLSTARLNVAGLEDSVVEEDRPVLDKSLKIIDDACVEVRNISHNMMPSALIRLGLIPAIKEVVDNINSSKNLKIDFNTNVSQSFGQSLDITVYRIIQEVLNNMIKHAKADHINMEITKQADNLQITMKDNGVGFDPEALNQSRGMGWKNIFSRVSMMNGTIDLDSKPQMGTVVLINLKLKHG